MDSGGRSRFGRGGLGGGSVAEVVSAVGAVSLPGTFTDSSKFDSRIRHR